jgi:DNA-binding response OmpR family regulator
MPKILFVEDDVALGQEVKEWLEEVEGFAIELVNSGEDALQMLNAFGFDLIVLDWSLPGLSGLSVCEQYRRGGGQTPILFLTGHDELSDKEQGFGTGADDYMTKPYDVRELALHCKALLRRAREVTHFGSQDRGLVLKPEARMLVVQDTEVHLTILECELLTFLMSRPGQRFSSADLLKAVWPSQKGTSEESVRSLIRGLRKKLDLLQNAATTDLIQTIGRSGYMYKP